jgi:hypothetical protein
LLILREERRQWLFENRVLRRIFGPKRNDVKESGENYVMKSLKISNPHQFFRVIKSSSMRWAGHVARMGRCAFRILVGKPEGKRLLGKLKRRWEDNIKMDIQEAVWGTRN